MMKHKFLVTILTHQRPDTVSTYRNLKRLGYTGPILLILDNEDPTLDEYRKHYRDDEIYVFDKAKEDEITDNCDNFLHRKTALYARNAAFRIVKELGYRYFVQFDDDYHHWQYRMGPNFTYNPRLIHNMDAVFDAYLDFYISSGADAITMALGGDFIGGSENQYIKGAWRVYRKCMASWFCDTEKPLKFAGHMNDDYSQYIVEGRRGKLFMQSYMTSVETVPTQSMSGDMTEAYKEAGTYVKTMYTVIQAPSCVRIGRMGRTNMRIHHSTLWNNCAVKIIQEKWKKQ